MTAPHEAASYWTPDEVAEALDGITLKTGARLWELLSEAGEQPASEEGTMVRVSGERGASDVTDTWVVQEYVERFDRLLVTRIRDCKRAVVSAKGGDLWYHRGPKVVVMRKHCTVEVNR